MLAQWICAFVGQKHNHKVKNRELAAELGVTEEYVSMVLNGHRDPAGAEEKFTAALNRIIQRRAQTTEVAG